MHISKRKHGKLAFLDVLISKIYHDLCTSVYLKMTSIDLYTRFVIFTPFSYKIGLIKTLIHCTYKISSSWASFNEDISKVKHLLMKNMYKLPYRDSFSNNNKKKINELWQKFCKNSNINIVFLLLKMVTCFRVKTVYLVL